MQDFERTPCKGMTPKNWAAIKIGATASKKVPSYMGGELFVEYSPFALLVQLACINKQNTVYSGKHNAFLILFAF
jgi:hypothetical protein